MKAGVPLVSLMPYYCMPVPADGLAAALTKKKKSNEERKKGKSERKKNRERKQRKNLTLVSSWQNTSAGTHVIHFTCSSVNY